MQSKLFYYMHSFTSDTGEKAACPEDALAAPTRFTTKTIELTQLN